MKLKVTLFLLLFFSVTCSKVSAQVPNGDFETWSLDGSGNMNPVYWETYNFAPDDTCVFPYTPAYNGNYSMRVTTWDFFGTPYPGIAFIEFPYTDRPEQICFCIKTTITPGDIGYVMMALQNGDSSIAAMDSCTFKFYNTTNQFNCYSFPINYLNPLIPDTAIIMVIAGDFTAPLLGTEVIVDDIRFDCPVGTGETPSLSSLAGAVYPNPSSHHTFIPLSLETGSEISVSISDLYGKEIKRIDKGFMAAGKRIIKLEVNDFATGLYFYTVNGNNFKFAGKFVVKD
jgi:hypothetical protein